MAPIRFIFVGGFLGAGKTTLLAEAARRLFERGHRVGLITNDQAPQLVDTRNLLDKGLSAAEVAGGCFCCRFDDLLTSARWLVDHVEPDILLCEPVGSCADISATVLQPLRQLHAGEFTLAPFSVVADVRRLGDLLSGRAKGLFPDSILYIYSKQLEEADLILLNKTDLVLPDEVAEVRQRLAEGYPAAEVREICALRGDGLDSWLDCILGDRPAAQQILEIDYDRYAEGEAALGWLNARADLQVVGGCDWQAVAADLMDGLRTALSSRHAEIAHLKLFLTALGGSVVASITRSSDAPFYLAHGDLDDRATDAELILNARVHLAPDALQAEVERALKQLPPAIHLTLRTLECFAPARPKPVHRMAGALPPPPNA